MYKLLENSLGRAMTGLSKAKRALVLAAGLAAAATAVAQPTNDNFVNATVISGFVGTTNGTTVGATSELGEPVHAGTGGGKSIWYRWTSPINGAMIFNTEGSSFDTVLAVYTGNSVSDLSLVAANDDVNFPLDLTSLVTFPVTFGTVYYIAVDGSAGNTGTVKLSWKSEGAGQFSFASSLATPNGQPLYIFSETENSDDTPDQNLITQVMTANGCSVSITRTAGATGHVRVHYTVTNGFYTNLIVTNIFGTNVFSTNFNTFPGPASGFTNSFNTNVVVDTFLQYAYAGDYVIDSFFPILCPEVAATNFSLTNNNGTLTPLIITNVSATPPPIPFPCVSSSVGGTNTNSTGTVTNVVVTFTNIFCTNIVIQQIVPSAQPFVDYIPDSGFIDFPDYQMNVDLPITILPVGGNTNCVVLVNLDSASFASTEISNISPPTVAGTGSGGTAFVNIYSTEIVDLATYFNPGVPQPDTNSICRLADQIYNFEKSVLWVDRTGKGSGVALVGIVRSGTNFINTSGSVSVATDAFFTGVEQNGFPLQPGSDYATPPAPLIVPSDQPVDCAGGIVTVNFVAGQTVAYVQIPIATNSLVQFNEDLFLSLFNPSGGFLGQINTATLTILYDNEPAGAVDRTWNVDNIATTTPPFNQTPGANSTVHALAVQPDNKTIIGGEFTAYNASQRYHIARIATDGLLDTTFLAFPNSGANDTITSLLLDSTGNIYIGGYFTSFNGTNRYGIARLNSSGGLDTTFNPGVGVNGVIWSMGLQGNGQLIIAGDFTAVNATNRLNIARLNTDGSLDTSFDPGISADGVINAIALQSSGKIIIAGDFTHVDSAIRTHIARLNSDGSLDPAFDPGVGPDDTIYALALQSSGTVIIGGAFNTVDAINTKSLARLNADGSLDQTFGVGTGADDTVYTLMVQPDTTVLVGGIFRSINGTRRVGLARLFSNGTVDTSFMDTAYNQFAGLINPNYNDPKNSLFALGAQSDGSVMIGGSFVQVGGGFTRADIHPRFNVARLIGGSTPGPGNVGLLATNFNVDLNGGAAFISMTRINGTLGNASVTVGTVSPPAGPGAAVLGTDYTFDSTTFGNPVWGNDGDSWMQLDGLSGPNFAELDVFGNVTPNTSPVFVTILGNKNPNGNRTLNVNVSNPQNQDIFFLGGENIPLGVALANQTGSVLTIVDNSVAHGAIGFSSPTYAVDENAGTATITLTRTNGSSGLATVQYATVAGGTAQPGSTNDYLSTSGTLTFNTGQTNKSFTIPIINNFVAQQDRTVFLNIANPSGGASLGLSNAVLTIINDNFAPGHLQFSVAAYGVHETAGTATITVTRRGGSSGIVSVYCASTNGTATSGTNFTATTNLLSWNSGDTSPRTFTVPILHDGLVTTNLTVNLRLFSAMVAGVTNNAALGILPTAVLTITNDDFYGNPTFSLAAYQVNENAGFVTITVNRLGGSAQTITTDYATSDGTAFQSFDYTPASGTLTFQPGVFSQSFNVAINDDLLQNGNRYFNVKLSNPTPAGATLGTPSTATVTIIDNETYNQPAGQPDNTYNPGAAFNGTIYTLALQGDGRLLAGGDFTVANDIARNHLARLNPDGTLDVKFSSPNEGTDNSVRVMKQQTDGRVLIGGLFQTVNGVNRSYLARLNADASLDLTFNPGSGSDNPVYALAETFINGVRKVVVGGSFASLNGVNLNDVAELNDDGTVNPAFTASGANGTVYTLAVYSTNDINSGKILIGGDFTTVNGVPRNHIARLNVDGSLDTTFNPGAGPNDSVRALAIQVDGKAVIGGLFTAVGGSGLNHIARLNANGSVDFTFNPGVGANDEVTCIALQEDHKIVFGGSFTQASGVTRNRLTRLNADGSVDPSINFGSGADAFIASVVIQADERIIVGGAFTQFAGQSKPHLARLNGLTTPGQGSLTFITANYQVVANATNALITIRRDGGTGDSAIGTDFVTFATSDGTGVNGVNYLGTTNVLAFPVGETFQYVTIPVFDTHLIDGNHTVNLTLSNPTDAALGVQPTATLTILNDNAGVAFSTASYTVNKNANNGAAVITILRNNSTIGSASVDFATTGSGTATPGTDYTPISGTILFTDGQSSNTIAVPVINNGLVEGARTVGLTLSNPTNATLTSPSAATLTIIDNSLAAGALTFSATNYSVAETAGNATITVLRTNGSIGQISVQYTANGGTATPGLDYAPTNNTLTFGDGVTSQTFAVQVFHNPLVTGNQTVNLTLTNATGGAQILQPATVPLTIVDVDVGLSFSQPGYFVSETSGNITISVLRLSGTNGSVTVSYLTADGTAVNGTNYTAQSGTLSFAPGETLKTFTVPILHDPRITGNLNFSVNLTHPSAPGQLVTPFSAVVTVLDVDTGLSFSTPTNSISEAGGSQLISVIRSGSTVGQISVTFSTSDTNGIAGIRYVPTNGVMVFADGQNSNSFSIPIINDHLVNGDQNFSISLSNATAGAQLIVPSTEVVTIIDDDSGLSFSSGNYSVVENGVAATITVIRTGVTNNTVTVNYATSDGTARAGIHYLAASGTLTFTNGQTSASFNVPIIDANIVGGSDTINVTLSNPSGTGTLVSPTAALITIFNNDGSVIVPAGSSLISESGPVNGAIDPGETVTMLLALRNAAGATATNVTATLLAASGVTLPSPSTPVGYGTLVTNGPSVSRQFSFTANGANGGIINAVLQLHYGTNVSTVSYSFALGRSTNTYSSPAVITIPDRGTATPYPATISISSLNGLVGQVTATVSNLAHGSISDVSMLLAGPAGQSDLLMAKAGGQHFITNVTLTFDDNAVASLTSAAPVSGTYKPTAFSTSIPFPASSNGSGFLQGPFATSLTNLIGSNPNGLWSLYVYDDTTLGSGGIYNGWSLNISTLNIVTPTVDLVAGLTASANPSIVNSNLTYTITLTNSGPSTATGVLLTNVLPAGITNAVTTSTTQGSWAANASGQLVCNIGTLAKDATVTATVVINPTVLGSITNTITAVANETEANPLNNTATVVTTITTPTADLAIGIVDSPDPVSIGAVLSYTITVTNLGPATAANVIVTNTLPPGVSNITVIPPGGTTNGNVITYSLGNLGSGGVGTFVITVTPVAAGTITNSAIVGSDVLDPLKGNNRASVKTVVQGVPLSVSISGSVLTFQWPVGGGTYALQSTPSLAPPVVWSPVTPATLTVQNGQNVATVNIVPGTLFFRLVQTGP
jgi:uncharacterized repeat protein (TIGR01451 family)/uncharacterized delta-60 repeat protein